MVTVTVHQTYVVVEGGSSRRTKLAGPSARRSVHDFPEAGRHRDPDARAGRVLRVARDLQGASPVAHHRHAQFGRHWIGFPFIGHVPPRN